MRAVEPGHDVILRCRPGGAPRLDGRRPEPEGPRAKRVVVVHHLARPDMDCDCLDRPSGAGRQRPPRVVGDSGEIRHQRLALVRGLEAATVERVVEHVEELVDGGSAHGHPQTRVWYSPVRVSTRIVSPSLTKIGTWTT